MRRMLIALAAGLAAAGGATAIDGAAQAQPYGSYTGPDAHDYSYRYDPPRAYDAAGRYTPYSYENGYDYSALPAQSAALPAAVIAPVVLGHAAYDRYGPDPNGTVAPDGHVIKCKLADSSSGYRRHWVRRRECW